MQRELRPRPDLSTIASEALGDGHLTYARAKAHEALVVDPSDALAHNVLARCLLREGLVKESLAPAVEAVRLEPSRAFFHWTVGHIHQSRGWARDGVEHHREAARLAPDDPYYVIKLAECLVANGFALIRELRQPWFEEAQTLIEQVMATGVTEALDRYVLASVLRDLTKHEEALELVEGLIVEAPNDEAHWTLKVDCLRRLKRFEEGIETVRATRPTFPASSALRYLEGQCLFGLWRLDECEKVLLEALDLDGGDPNRDDLLRRISQQRSREAEANRPPRPPFQPPPGPWDDCPHPRARANNLSSPVRIYLCDDCGGAMRCHCESEAGKYLPGGHDDVPSRSRFIGWQSVCPECRGLPSPATPCGSGGKVATWYWREIMYLHHELFAKRWPDRKLPDFTPREEAALVASSDDALELFKEEQSRRRDALSNEVRKESRAFYKRLHATNPKYTF